MQPLAMIGFRIFLWTALIYWLAAQPLVGAGDAPILIGLLLPPEEAQAASLRQGAQLGVDRANALPGPRACLLIRGRIGQWGADGEEAGKMVIDEAVGGLIASPGGAPSHLALQVSGRTATPVISLCSDSSVTKAGIPWMVRMVPGSVDEAGAIFAALKTSASGRPFRWGALVPSERAGREASKDLAKAAQASGCHLDEPCKLPDTPFEIDGVLKRMLTAKPDGILIWLDPVFAGKIAKSLRAAGFLGPLAGPGRLDGEDFVTTAGNAAEGFMMPRLVRDPASQAAFAAFASEYRKRFGSEPDVTATMVGDAAALLIELARKSGDQPLYRAFPIAQERPGASGLLKFDTAGNRVYSLELMSVRSGHLAPFAQQ